MKHKILFIINPISGTGQQQQVIKYIHKILNKELFDYQIVTTQYAGHAIELSRLAAYSKNMENEPLPEGKFHTIVAVGGDGTINEIAQGMIGSDTNLAIIPVGSGNGLARFLGIPIQIASAIRKINNLKVKRIDTATLNNNTFVNVAGIGFDALISHQFAKNEKRGFITYLKLILYEFWKFPASSCCIDIDGVSYTVTFFLITYANSSTWGNNAHIAPQAIIDDGLLDIAIVKPFPLYRVPELAIRLLTKTIHKSKYCQIIRGKVAEIETGSLIQAHADGDPIVLNNKLRVAIVPASLNVIVG